jgi:CheY-like chemotaxis protein
MPRNKIIKVLHADDDPDDRELFQQALLSLGYKIHLTCAKNGVQAISAIDKLSPHIIFLDLNMPVRCGMQCLREIRRKETFTGIPVIILSSSSAKSDILSAFDSGADLYIFKPIIADDYTRILHQVLTLHIAGELLGKDKNNFIVDFKAYSLKPTA